MPEIEEDKKLMRAYQRGDMDAFRTLYGRYSGKVYAYIRSRVERREARDEIFQNVFLKFHRVRAKYDPKYPVLQWLFVITHSAIIDYMRREEVQSRGKNLEITDTYKELSQEAPNPALLEQEDPELLARLRPAEREAVRLRVLEELSYQEIAKKLEQTESNIRQIVSRALRKLRKI